jgi:hypothetical protein
MPRWLTGRARTPSNVGVKARDTRQLKYLPSRRIDTDRFLRYVRRAQTYRTAKP